MIMMGGSQTELFRWPAAELYLVDRDDRALLQRGMFTLFLATHSNSPQLVAVEAMVADVQWPVGKDCEVAYRAGENSMHILTFALQSLVYELVLVERDGYGGMHVAKLQDLLSLYTTFSLQGSGSQAGTLEEAAGKYWMGMAGQILEPDESLEEEDDKIGLQLSLSGRYMQRGGLRSATVATSDVEGTSVDASILHKHRRIMKKMHQARRTSAVAKLFSKALMKGAISPDMHTLMVTRGEEHGSGAKGTTEVRPAVADVDVVAKVVDMVEKKATLRDVVVVQQKRRKTGGSMSTWTLNEEGLHLLMKAVVAANMIAASASSTAAPAAAVGALSLQRPPSAPPPAAQFPFLASVHIPATPDRQHHVGPAPPGNQLA